MTLVVTRKQLLTMVAAAVAKVFRTVATHLHVWMPK